MGAGLELEQRLEVVRTLFLKQREQEDQLAYATYVLIANPDSIARVKPDNGVVG